MMKIESVSAIVFCVLFVLVSSVPSFAQRRPGDSRREGNLKVGNLAPDFNLKRLRGEGKVKLSSFKGKRPVVLIFGSYT